MALTRRVTARPRRAGASRVGAGVDRGGWLGSSAFAEATAERSLGYRAFTEEFLPPVPSKTKLPDRVEPSTLGNEHCQGMLFQAILLHPDSPKT